jgi:DnaJ-class molecular chaperone
MDHYATLGINKSASPDDIKRAYRKLASQHHPDKGGDTATFQKIQAAYETLSDPNKKQQYDTPISPGFQQFNGMPPGFEDIFNNMMGGRASPFGDIFGGQHKRQPQPPMFRTTIEISLEQAYNGGEQGVRLQTGTNTHIAQIQVPKGIVNGGQVRIDNVIQGASLIVEFRIRPHLKFDRQINDLISNQPISVLDLIIGTSFEFITMSGKTLEVKINPKTQPHMQLKIAGEGMPLLGSSAYGDQIILLKPFIPDIIDEQIVNSILQSKAKL